MRLSVEIGVRTIKLKTSRAVLDHVVQTIQLNTGEFCEPLALDYARCIRALLAYQPHLNHLSASEWESIAVFCAGCIKRAETDVGEEDGHVFDDGATTRSTANNLSYRSSRSYARDAGGSQGARPFPKQIAEEMNACLRLLTAAPNNPLKQKVSLLLWTLVDFLRNPSLAGRSPQDAFGAINNIISWSRTENTKLTQRVTVHMIRLVRHYWPNKSPALREELIISLVLLEPYFRLKSDDPGSTLLSELAGLSETVQTEYSRRLEREQLNIDDLRLGSNYGVERRSSMIGTALFGLRCCGSRAEHGWFTIHTLASIISSLIRKHETDEASDIEAVRNGSSEITPRPSKRRRSNDILVDLITSTTTGTPLARTCSLQLLTFLFQLRAFDADQLIRAVDLFSGCCSEETGSIASWAFLALASCASQISASSPTLENRWSAVWQLACRALTNSSSCRASSYTLFILLKLRLVPQTSFSELENIITTSMDLSGPAVIADSVALLLTAVVKSSQQQNPASIAADSVVRWWSRTFTPSRFNDKAFTLGSTTYEAADLVSLVHVCLNQTPHSLLHTPLPIWEAIAQVWLHCQDQQDLVSYLLVQTENSVVTNPSMQEAQMGSSVALSKLSCETAVLTFLTTELAQINEAWIQAVQIRAQNVSTDVFSGLCKALCILTCLSHCVTFRDSRRQSQVQEQVSALLKLLCDFTSSSQCEQPQFDGLLSALSVALSALGYHHSDFFYCPSKCEKSLSRAVSDAVATRCHPEEFQDADLMELDEYGDSQNSRNGRERSNIYELTLKTGSRFSGEVMRCSVGIYAVAANLVSDFDGYPQGAQEVSKRMIDHIISLPESSVLSSHKVIANLPKLQLMINAQDTERLLDFLMESILGSYTYERSEVAICTVLDVMSSLISIWTDTSNAELFDLGIEIYEWFTTKALPNRVLSPISQTKLGTLLLNLCDIDTNYAEGKDAPSVRTSLFSLFNMDSLAVQYHLAGRISGIFGRFVLSNHGAMFDDLQMSLPADSEWTEGIAMRLFCLSSLASQWHSLLRQCVYYIFETAGRVKASLQHATYCISELASRLPLKSSKKLFSLFAPQLLHTWLDSQPLTSLPYSAFQYSNLTELLKTNQAEICAQLVMRGDEDGLTVMATSLKIEKGKLIERSFAKCLSYAISRDISTVQKESNPTPCENRLRNIVGTKEDFKSFAVQRFPTIMGYFFLSMQQEDLQDKWLEKRTTYSSALEALVEIKSYNHSTRQLPASQQPSFRSKYLCDQIERLCRRTGQDPLQPWNCSSFTLACRMLLDGMDASLGSLHNCLMIRRLRTLICMAGAVACTGFPLEMLVHSLRPFASDSECADDVLGILQYLFHHGQDYLRSNLEFSCGNIILLVLQVRKHSLGRQDSITHESQHLATVQKMFDFQTWLVKYLSMLTSDMSQTIIDVLNRSLERLNLPGNARKDSPESSLLLFLLDQRVASESLCSRAVCAEAMSVLSENFKVPIAASEDCLAENDAAATYAKQLWDVLRESHLSESFTIWAASVLGRAYASTGVRPRELPENRSIVSLASKASIHEGVAGSQLVLARRLSEALYSKSHREAGLAEYTLRKIAESFKDPEEALAFEQMIPVVVQPVAEHGDYGYLPVSLLDRFFDVGDAKPLRRILDTTADETIENWATKLAVTVCDWAAGIPIVSALTPIMSNVTGLALELLPSVLHILLAREIDKEPVLRTELSAAMSKHFAEEGSAFHAKQQFWLRLWLYLKAQQYPGEATPADRLRWLEVDLLLAAGAAARCGMPTCALMLAESTPPISQSNKRASRQASASQMAPVPISDELLLAIFKQVEETDSFYSVQQPASLHSVLDRLDHERDGFKSLMFRSAQMDSHMRNAHRLEDTDAAGMVHSLLALNLNSLTFALLMRGWGNEGDYSKEMLTAARALQQWNISPPEQQQEEASTTFSIFQELSRATDLQHVHLKLRSAINTHSQLTAKSDAKKVLPHSWYGVLGTLTEIGEVMSCTNQTEMFSIWRNMQARESWMHVASYDHTFPILSNRQTLFGVLGQSDALQKTMHLGRKQSRIIEVQSMLNASKFARGLSRLQEALTITTSLNDMLEPCNSINLKIEAAVKLETASVLWDSGEASASVKMLQDVLDVPDLENQDIPVGRSGLLAQLGHQLAEARLEAPEDILTRYLEPAIDHLKGRKEGSEAGKVFCEFASFCDDELQNPGSIENINRIGKLRQRKEEEINALKLAMKNGKKSDDDRKSYEKSLNEAQKWYEIDDAEWQRLKQNRDTFVQQSLRNYLLALRASEEHDFCILRFFALWLENSEEGAANKIVAKYLADVPSWKFVLLMNQIMSRLDSNSSAFQNALKALTTSLCLEHPYHSLHHLFASTRKPLSKQDVVATSRYKAALTIAHQIQNDPKRGDLLNSMFRGDSYYNMLAFAKPENHRHGNKIAAKDFPQALKVAQHIPALQIPPATISLPLQADGDYKNVPVASKFGSSVTIFGGLSAPKMLTIVASDGQQYKQLFKSGNDDLRQDAIMEQVFEEVSKMLQKHKDTRQRDLKVRVYKVIPLSTRSGIIEFVPNSLPIGEFLKPAHLRYHPQDYKDSKARDMIRTVEKNSLETRLKEYRKVCDRMHPVLRHFFTERFHDPDEWFAKRTSYTRTTASVSMLGHVLGLGDRHCQNILLDERTGEVVHIDLGVAFEAGRVLTIPELVPFRLTRDVIDGMGITKTEGVFRRCCEFTMDALRQDKNSIMTLLNVLRYDPLYSWTLSPLRAKRIQDAQEMSRAGENGNGDSSGGNKEQDVEQADRALSIVEKKLSTTLSVAATVNELIQQATDERNLATLFGGWAPYF